jgi:hypothetical protein
MIKIDNPGSNNRDIFILVQCLLVVGGHCGSDQVEYHNGVLTSVKATNYRLGAIQADGVI